nr:uncharacterized protein LOC128698802 isoform X1 [Cherax quadricarinatus]
MRGGHGWWWWVWAWVWAWALWRRGWGSDGAVIPPRWVNTTLNPCARKSWQLLYWPRDNSCHRIFTQGPCGETQEFYYDPSLGKGACRCPRGSLLYPRTGLCYPQFSQGPCSPRQYLDLDKDGRKGQCYDFLKCPLRHVYWPRTNTCYEYHTRGPCLKGYLIYVNPNTGFPECGCERNLMFSNYWSLTGLCFELFKRGPCLEGAIFLYNATKGATECSCSPSIITNYHNESDGCYELNQQGPCLPGQILTFEPNAMSTKCQCRKDHGLWPLSGHCYRLYSRGPCEKGHFFTPTTNNSTNMVGECQVYPCTGTHRYHSAADSCFRLGWRAPCPEGQLFIYDEESPLRGMCGCTSELVGFWAADEQCYELGSRGPCQHSQILSYDKATGSVLCTCDMRKGFITWHDGLCYRLETRGPCSAGQVLGVKKWRPITPICTSLTSSLFPDNPLIFKDASSRESTPHQHHESNSVTASRDDNIYALGTLNETLTIDTSNASNSQNAEPEPQLKMASGNTHRSERQLDDRPMPTNIYSLGAVDDMYETSDKNMEYYPGRSGRSMADTETWGLLDGTYPRSPDGTYYTGRSDGERSLTPWWGSITAAT